MVGNVRIWIFGAILCPVVICSSCEKESPPVTMQSTEVEPSIAEQIREVLPEGWLLIASEGVLRIEKMRPVKGDIIYPGHFEKPPRDIEFWFALRPVETVEPEAYEAIKKKQLKLKDQAYGLFHSADMRSFSMNLKSKIEEMPFDPKTTEQREAVVRLKAICDQFEPLPQLYWNGVSYRMDYPSSENGNMGYWLVNKEEHRECVEAVRAVRGLFYLYEGNFSQDPPESPLTPVIPPTPFCSFHDWEDR